MNLDKSFRSVESLGLGLLIAASLILAVPGALAQAKGATADDGVKVGKPGFGSSLASSNELEKTAQLQYEQLKREAQAKRALAPPDNEAVIRLRRIAARIIPFASRFNERASKWQWEVNLLGSPQINAFCMPGGKIAFFSGIITKLRLTDDEIAMVMGHEMAHALREHGREQLGKQRIAQGVQISASILSSLLGYGNLGGQVAGGAAKVTLLKFSRDDESEADLVGLDLAARAGYDPRAAIVLWDKMSAAAKGEPPQWLSTHPSNSSRTEEIRKHLPETLPLYARAVGVNVNSLPPYASNMAPAR